MKRSYFSEYILTGMAIFLAIAGKPEMVLNCVIGIAILAEIKSINTGEE